MRRYKKSKSSQTENEKRKSYDKEMYRCGTGDQLEVKLKKKKVCGVFFFGLGTELSQRFIASK